MYRSVRYATKGRKMAEDVAKVVEPPKVSKAIYPTPPKNPFSAQPAPHLKPKWDEPELDPEKRLSIAEDPDGSKNAAAMAEAIERHQNGVVPTEE